MRDLLVMLAVFFLTLILHIVWCRVGRTKTLQLAVFFYLSFANGIILLWQIGFFTRPTSAETLPNLWYVPLKLTAVVLYVLLIVFYFAFYLGMIIDSPSRVILRTIKEHRQLSYNDLSSAVDSGRFIKSRLDALIQHRGVVFDGQSYRLSPLGYGIACFLNLYTNILGKDIGG